MTHRAGFAIFVILIAWGVDPVLAMAGDSRARTLLNATFDGSVDGWDAWAPRGEIAPASSWDGSVGRTGAGSLMMASEGDPSRFGAWKRTVGEIVPGKHYTFTAWFRCEAVDHPVRSVIPRLVWLDDRGRRVRPPDFVSAHDEVDGWHVVRYTTVAPAKASQVEIQLGFGFSQRGRVWFDDVGLSEVNAPRERVVRVATIHHRPQGTKNANESLAAFEEKVRATASLNPDIICLPEGITVVGNPQSYIEVSESIPGPTTKRLGLLADRLDTYIAAGIYERVGAVVYNTAVLLDREGKLVGRYRKTHLPREEWEAGLTPGNDYPVFDTDFGRVGLMICWDVQFPEPARAMALHGAELLLLPIWGGSELLARARAQENHVFLVSSSYDMRSFVVDPTGTVIGEATESQPIAVTDVRLDHQFLQPWLGDMRHRTWKERRPDIPVE